jgi:hypothetical protein
MEGHGSWRAMAHGGPWPHSMAVPKRATVKGKSSSVTLYLRFRDSDRLQSKACTRSTSKCTVTALVRRNQHGSADTGSRNGNYVA